MKDNDLVDSFTLKHISAWALFYLAYLGVIKPPESLKGFEIPTNDGYLYLPLMAISAFLLCNSINLHHQRKGKLAFKYKESIRTNKYLLGKQEAAINLETKKTVKTDKAHVVLKNPPYLDCGRYTKRGGGLTDPIRVKVGKLEISWILLIEAIKTIFSSEKKPFFIYATTAHTIILSLDGFITFIVTLTKT